MIAENEKTIEELENELGCARDCLNKVFADLPSTELFDPDSRVT